VAKAQLEDTVKISL